MLAIIGPGAVGTVLAGYLGAAGRPLRLIGTPKDIAAAQAVERLIVERVTGGPPLQLPRPPLGTTVDAGSTSAIATSLETVDQRRLKLSSSLASPRPPQELPELCSCATF